MTQGLHESGIVEGLRSRKLDFPNICNLFHRFQVYKTIICSPVLLIHFFCYFVHGKRRRFLPPGTYAFLTSSFHVPLDTVFTKYDEIMSKDELKFAQKVVFCKRSRIE